MIRIDSLAKAYGEKVLLRDATYHFPQRERVALVGANGVGKTTLLNMVCGLLEPDKGTVIRPRECSLGYLPQEPNSNPAPTIIEECIAGAYRATQYRKARDEALSAMEREFTDESHARFEACEHAFESIGGYGIENRAREILTGLGFRPQHFDRSPTVLSGGWRMRLELARVFINNPEFLLLDEPTNHLDLPSLVWVERYLQGFEGTLLFVSHDRALLNRMATIILHLHCGKLTPYKGNFDDFLEERERRAEEDAARAEQLRKQREAIETFVRRFGAKASKAVQAQSRLKMISRIRALEGEVSPSSQEESLAFSLPTPEISGREVLTVEDLSIGYSHPLTEPLSFRIQRGQKVAIIGANGLGKSTLLKTIAGKIPALGGSTHEGHKVHAAWFAQDQLDVLDPDATALANVMSASAHLSERQARALLGQFLFHGDEVFKPVRVLSGGEKSRVGLVRLLATKSNFLLLDEPTNHLDMSSVEALAQAVDDFEGTVLFVSHDRTFIDETCTHVFAMLPDGRSGLFTGKLDDYRRLAAASGFPDVLDAGLNELPRKLNTLDNRDESAESSNKNDDVRASELKRERQRLERAFATCEKRLDGLHEKVKQLELRIIEESQLNFTAVRELHEEQKRTQAELASVEEEWMLTSEQLESTCKELKALGRL